MSTISLNLASATSNEENKREKRAPNISFPTPKSEPNLPSAYIFPREPNERGRDADKQTTGESVSEISGLTLSIP